MQSSPPGASSFLLGSALASPSGLLAGFVEQSLYLLLEKVAREIEKFFGLLFSFFEV